MSIDKFKPKIIVILGPTASGKSDLAVDIALWLGSKQALKKFGMNGAEIISADSRQVYKGLDIGSGKITKKEMKGVPHYLLGAASPKRIFTVSQYQKIARKAVEKILKTGKLPIICGGAGLYIDSIIYGIKFPEVPPQKKLRKELEKLTTEELFKKLQKLDRKRAKSIDKHNRRRLIRALEIVTTTGKSVPLLPKNNPRDYAVLKIGVKKSPEQLKTLIAKRLKKRLKQGMVEEVKKLRKQGLSWERLDNLGLEYRYVSRYLRGIISKKEIIETLQKEIWRYAKRQMTWFKKDPSIHWVSSAKKAGSLTREFLISDNS